MSDDIPLNDLPDMVAGQSLPEPSEAVATPEPVRSEPSAPMPIPNTGHIHARVPFMLGCTIALACVLVATVVGGVAGVAASRWFDDSHNPASQTASSPISSTQEPVAAAAVMALPSVVNIDVTSSKATSSGLPNGHPDVPTGGTGSGVAYKAAPDGGTYIITNDHVVDGATTIVVTPADGERYDATLVGRDPETDIAVVRISKALPLASVGDSEKLVVGQMVVAIGSPFGLQHSVSSGVVSALHRSLTNNYSADSTGSAYPLVDVIQTDAAINPGNSGGALIDRTGRLVGIDSAIYSESGSNEGIGFAIPAKTAMRIADELIAGKKATHPFLGIEGLTVTTSTAKSLGLTKAEGALVQNVIPGTGAAKAGLKKDDVVLAVGNQPVRTMDDLILQVRRTVVGDRVILKVWRARAEVTLDMVVGDKPASTP